MKGTVYFYNGSTEEIKRYLKKSDRYIVFSTNTANYIYRSDGKNECFLRVKTVTYEWGGYRTTFVPVTYINKIILKEVSY